MEQFSASISYDQRLYAYDIQGSIAHCKMLAKCGIIKSSESAKIRKGLAQILKEFEDGVFECDDKLEDIHMNIEHRLTQLIGPVAGKLHTARSRNDQVCLDVRLYLRDETQHIIRLADQFCKTLVKLARKHIDYIMPGYTHMQRAQPVHLSHHLLAYVEMFQRDRDRMQDALARINVMPLGSAALAGTNFPIDRSYTAKLLDFPAMTHNSMDAVSDRDFMIEFCAASSIIMMHLSRLCEEIILWSTSEFNFIELSDAFSTGSSIMPQKKNPDSAELIRGKTGRVYGNLVSLLSMMKSLPMAYNRDLQEDKEPLFDTADTVGHSLALINLALKTAKFKRIPLATLEASGFLTATDMADYLVLKDIPFREAHEITGKAVALCLSKKKTLDQLTLAEMKELSPKIREDIFDLISMEGSAERKNVYGGTARKQVEKQLARLEKKLK